MKAQFVQQGAAVDHVPTADLPAGSVVVIGDLVGITKHDLKANVLGSIAVEGVFDIIKDTALVVPSGSKIYWDAANSLAVLTATGNKQIGKSVAAAPVGTTLVRTRLSQ